MPVPNSGNGRMSFQKQAKVPVLELISTVPRESATVPASAAFVRFCHSGSGMTIIFIPSIRQNGNSSHNCIVVTGKNLVVQIRYNFQRSRIKIIFADEAVVYKYVFIVVLVQGAFV